MKRKNKNALIWTIAIAAVFAGLFGVSRLAQGPSSNQPIDNSASVILAVKPDDWFKGGESAKVVLIEYSDFQCPACAAFAPVVKGLIEEFGEDLKIVYRHFPLFQSHLNAISAAEASEAAGGQGKFWQMHDMIFDNQREWENSRKAKDIFKGYAVSIGIDAEKFSEDLNSKEVDNAVKSDLKDAQKLNLSYTPTFILNGERIENPRSYEQFRDLINQAILESQN